MKDTPDDVQARFERLIMAKAPAERLAMACRMFQTAKALAIAGIRHRHGDLTPRELREHLLRHFYGQDFTESQLQAISRSLAD